MKEREKEYHSVNDLNMTPSAQLGTGLRRRPQSKAHYTHWNTKTLRALSAKPFKLATPPTAGTTGAGDGGGDAGGLAYGWNLGLLEHSLAQWPYSLQMWHGP